jgi:hypothetical protein
MALIGLILSRTLLILEVCIVFILSGTWQRCTLFHGFILVFTKISDLHPVEELAEIGGFYAQVIGQVFMGYQLQDMGAAAQQLPEFFFGRKTLQLHQPFQHARQGMR